MSATVGIWLLLFFSLAGMAFVRPVYGFCLYMLTCFALPGMWWWGDGAMATYRWNLYAGVIFLCAVLKDGDRPALFQFPEFPWISRLAWWMFVNATVVHMLFAADFTTSSTAYFLLIKFVLLFFLIVASLRTESDFRIAVFTLLIGLSYLGWEATINQRGDIVEGRLEGIGLPGASQANELASLVVTLLPLVGGLLVIGTRREKIGVALGSPLALNLVMLCNSRGAFLSLFSAAGMFLYAARGPARRKAIWGLLLGGIAAWMLMGDPKIVNRFYSTFDSADRRDKSADNRLLFWQAGLMMISDEPFGAGGGAFKRVNGWRYLQQVGSSLTTISVHNGFINEACEWGVQGLAMRLGLIGYAMWLTWQTMGFRRELGDGNHLLYGACLLSGMVAFLTTSLFGDFLDAEWGFWTVALMVCYTRLYGPFGFDDSEWQAETFAFDGTDAFQPPATTAVQHTVS
jgi:hypothetical protein